MVTESGQAAVQERGPPAQWLFHTVINPLVTLLLRSPLHGVVSDSLMLITFTGRKSGREYTTPVGYHEFNDGLIVFTHSGWWRNLRGGTEVTLRLKGDRLVAHASPIEDPETVAEYILAFIDANGLDAARRIGLEFTDEDPPSKQQLTEGIDKTVVIELTLEAQIDG